MVYHLKALWDIIMNDMWLFVTRNNLERVVNPRDATINNVPRAVEILLGHFDSRGQVLDPPRAAPLIDILSGVTVRRGVEHIDIDRVFWHQVLAHTDHPHQFAATLMSALSVSLGDIDAMRSSKAWGVLKNWLSVTDSLLAGAPHCGLNDTISIMYGISESMFGAHWYEMAGFGRPVNWTDFLTAISLQKPAFISGIVRGPLGVDPLPLPDMGLGCAP